MLALMLAYVCAGCLAVWLVSNSYTLVQPALLLFYFLALQLNSGEQSFF